MISDRIIYTKSSCIDGEICERRYLEVNSLYSIYPKVLAICPQLLSSRIQKHRYDSSFYGCSVQQAYIELIKEYFNEEYGNVSFYPRFNRENLNDLLNWNMYFIVCKKTYITRSITVKEFLELCFENRDVMWHNHEMFVSICNEYFKYSYDRYKKYKVRYSKLKTLVKRMQYESFTKLQISINELLTELLYINSRYKNN